MKRREFVKTLGAAAAGLATAGCHRKSIPSRDRPPNLLVIVTDDQRHDTLGCAGHPIIHTPNMDGLAERGVRFEQAFATTPICAASRASLFTGLYERAHGYTFTKPPIPSSYTRHSYPFLLREAGYYSGFIGKFGVQIEEGEQDAMFDWFRPTSYPYFKEIGGKSRHLSEIHGDMAAQFLRERPLDKPFCLSLSFWAPHADDGAQQQYFWPPFCDAMYDEVSVPVPATADPSFHAALPDFLRKSLNRVRWFWRFDSPEKYQAMTKGYFRMISGVDGVIGRILEELRLLRLERDTVIVFTSDNGYFLGERGFAGKWLMHEPSIRIPLFIHDPRLSVRTRGTTRSEPVLNLDITPTLLDLAGVPVPEHMQGRSLMPWVRGEGEAERGEVFCEHLWDHPDIPQTECLRADGWKYIRYPQHPEFEELYELTSDPHESRNLAGDPARGGILNDYRQRCRERADKAGRAGERM